MGKQGTKPYLLPFNSCLLGNPFPTLYPRKTPFSCWRGTVFHAYLPRFGFGSRRPFYGSFSVAGVVEFQKSDAYLWVFISPPSVCRTSCASAALPGGRPDAAYELCSPWRISPRTNFPLAPEDDSCGGYPLERTGTKKTFRWKACDRLVRTWDIGFDAWIGPNFVDRRLNVYRDSVYLPKSSSVICNDRGIQGISFNTIFGKLTQRDKRRLIHKIPLLI